MKKQAFSCSLAAAIASVVAAQALAVEPASIQAGGVTITPTLDLSTAYDDNIREVGINDETSWVTSITPGVLIEALDRLNLYQLKYSARHDIFHSSHDDDNTDHHLNGLAHLEFNSRNRLDLTTSYDRTESVTGSWVPGVNDKLSTTRVGGVYGFGLPSAIMNFDVGVHHDWRRSHNSGTINDNREYDKLGFNAVVYYRVAPKTRALLEYRFDDYDYEVSNSPLSSERNALLLGVTWEATAKTTGTIKVGYEEREFDRKPFDDQDNVSWEADVTWQPRTYSTFTFSTSKGTEEGSVSANIVDTTRAGINWNHHWTSDVYTDLSYQYTEEDFESSLNREDEVNQFGVKVSYDVVRWMTVGLGYTFKDRDSNFAIRDYDRNVYMLNFNFSL